MVSQFSQIIPVNFLSGLQNQVPIIIGTMKQETDWAPSEIVIKYDHDQWNYFIQQRFGWLNENNVNKIKTMYNWTNYHSAQEIYDDISTDIKITCGNIDVSKKLASTSKFSVYSYVVSMVPTNLECYFDGYYCARYAFHMYDLLSLHQDIETPAWPLGEKDKQFGELFMSRWIEFAETGEINEWSIMDSEGQVNDLSLEEISRKSYKEDECKFWSEMGMDYLWWIN